MNNWKLRSAQFGALWADTGQDRIPNPFDVVSDIPTQDAYEVEQRQICAAFGGGEHVELKTAFSVLAEPQVYAEISGVTVDETPIRIIGCQRDAAVVIAVQQPGATSKIGGDVIVGSGHAGRLGAQLIGQIPQNAGGRRQFQRINSGDAVDEQPFMSVLQQVNAAPSASRFDDAVRRAHAGHGTIRVQRGPRYGRGREVGTVQWFDLAADGRYLIRSQDPAAVHPGGPEKLVAVLNALLRDGID